MTVRIWKHVVLVMVIGSCLQIYGQVVHSSDNPADGNVNEVTMPNGKSFSYDVLQRMIETRVLKKKAKVDEHRKLAEKQEPKVRKSKTDSRKEAGQENLSKKDIPEKEERIGQQGFLKAKKSKESIKPSFINESRSKVQAEQTKSRVVPFGIKPKTNNDQREVEEIDLMEGLPEKMFPKFSEKTNHRENADQFDTIRNRLQNNALKSTKMTGHIQADDNQFGTRKENIRGSFSEELVAQEKPSEEENPQANSENVDKIEPIGKVVSTEKTDLDSTGGNSNNDIIIETYKEQRGGLSW